MKYREQTKNLFRGFDGTRCRGVDSASKNEYQELAVGKDDRCIRLPTLPPSCAECREDPGALTSWNPKSLSRLVAGYLYLYVLVLLCGCVHEAMSVLRKAMGVLRVFKNSELREVLGSKRQGIDYRW
jgi:hypothetical protein